MRRLGSASVRRLGIIIIRVEAVNVMVDIAFVNVMVDIALVNVSLERAWSLSGMCWNVLECSWSWNVSVMGPSQNGRFSGKVEAVMASPHTW